jgi:hypothetical protein
MSTPASPAWLRVYQYFSESPPPIGTVVSHEELCRIAGLEWDVTRYRSQYYHAVAKACIELENERSRTLMTERGTGYRYVGGNTHLEKAITGAAAVRRKLVRVAGTVATVDVSGMTSPEVERVRNAQRSILDQMDQISQMRFPPPQFYSTQAGG